MTSTLRLSANLAAALACLLFAQATAPAAYAKKKPNYGRIQLSTTPAGFPLLVDGQPSGVTTTDVRVLDLAPGGHVIEVLLPNNERWRREVYIDAGRVYCIALNHKPTSFTINKSPCPYPVNVSAPSTVNDGDVVSFAADVTYGGASALNYTWTVSPASARIVSGAGSPTISVDTSGLGGQRVTAILVVDDGSGERNCRQSSQASTLVNTVTPPPVLPRKFDEFPSVAFDDDKARLDNLAIELQNAPTAQGYIIVYGGSASRAGQADRLGARARNYIVNTRGIDAGRVVVVNGGYRERDTFEVWVVPQGAQPPQPTPTSQPSEARPAPRGRGRRR